MITFLQMQLSNILLSIPSILFFFAISLPSILWGQIPTDGQELQSQKDSNEILFSNWNFSAEVGYPFLRTGSLDRLGEKRTGQLLSLSYFLVPSHGVTIGLGLDNYGLGGNLSAETTSLTNKDPKKLGAINFFMAYSFQDFLNEELSISYDVGLGIYRFTGIRDESTNKNLFSMIQHFGPSFNLPESLQYISGTKIKMGPSVSHTWIPESQLKDLNIKGHTLALNFHVRFAF